MFHDIPYFCMKIEIMSNAFYNVPVAINEPVRSYAPGSAERTLLLSKYKEMFHQEPIDVPLYIGSEQIRTETKKKLSPPHDHQKVLGYYNIGTAEHVEKAIEAALEARKKWSAMPWEERAAIFLKAADLLAVLLGIK